MVSMIERVGRALAKEEGYAYDPVPYDERARVAIAAMLEPTADMVDAGRDVGPDAPYGLSETIKRWQTMIDAALERKAD